MLTDLPICRSTALGAMLLVLHGITFAADIVLTAAPDKLLSVGEWTNLCTQMGEEPNLCLLRLTRPTKRTGRSGDDYALPAVAQKNTLLTRSGVLMAPAINKQLAEVQTDDGNQTLVTLKSGARCMTFAAHGAIYPTMDSIDALNSFVRVTTDNQSASAVIDFDSTIAGRNAIVFAQEGGGLIGAYKADRPHNAGIWAACFQARGETLKTAAKTFFTAILGSARRY